MRFLLLILAISCLSFQITDPCLLEVRQIFDNLNLASKTEKVTHINYTVIATLKDETGKNVINTGEFEMLSTAKQNRIYSKEMIVLKDQSNTFTILPSRKMIYISDAVLGKKDESLYDKLKVLQDTIFRNALKVECIEVKDKGYNKAITIFLNDRITKFLGIKKASYYIDDKNKILKRVFVEYIPNQQYFSVEYLFNEMDYDYKKVDMLVPVRKLIFEKENTLKKEYQGYNVIDNRKK